MNTQTRKPQFMLLFRGNDGSRRLSPEVRQRIADEWMAWFERRTTQGKALAGSPLEEEGRLVFDIKDCYA